MKIKMKMPDLATNEGAAIRISTWLIEVGQPVKRGQPLLEVETDKALQEVECIATGTLETIHAQAGDDVQVGAVIATIGVE
jgi:pyruvate/2-oxoglutarate dehydrogenase complex dihydrolipoamide acyltransferase (E2) component